jgi:hypothetical protein
MAHRLGTEPIPFEETQFEWSSSVAPVLPEYPTLLKSADFSWKNPGFDLEPGGEQDHKLSHPHSCSPAVSRLFRSVISALVLICARCQQELPTSQINSAFQLNAWLADSHLPAVSRPAPS